jgi:multisubunit Na+/H+ antiporter MnhF subunit
MVAAIAALLFFTGALACALRALVGPSLHDRIVAVHAFVMASALAAAALAVAYADTAYLDLAFVLALSDVLTVVVGFKFLRRRSMQTPLAPLDAREGAQ